jgi:hypothetical protein
LLLQLHQEALSLKNRVSDNQGEQNRRFLGIKPVMTKQKYIYSQVCGLYAFGELREPQLHTLCESRVDLVSSGGTPYALYRLCSYNKQPEHLYIDEYI